MVFAGQVNVFAGQVNAFGGLVNDFADRVKWTPFPRELVRNIVSEAPVRSPAGA